MALDVPKLFTQEDIKAGVVAKLKSYGTTSLGGFDRLEHAGHREALSRPVKDTVFAVIGEALTEMGQPGDFTKLGGVMTGLGVHDPKQAQDIAHEIGCYCHGDVTGDLAAKRVEELI